MKNLALLITLFLLLSHFVSGQPRDLNQLVEYCAEAPNVRYFTDPDNNFAENFAMLKEQLEKKTTGFLPMDGFTTFVLDIAFPVVAFGEMILNALIMIFWGLMWFVGGVPA